jgi:hypothetical protein
MMRTRSRIALAAAVVLVLPLAAELAYRGWYWAAGKPYSSETAVGRMSELHWETDEARRALNPGRIAKRVPSPFFGWEELEIQERLHAETEYFRSPEAELAYDVLIVGGAGAEAFAEEGFETLAKVLTSLRRFTDRPVRPVVLAREGFKQPQQLNLVGYVLMLGWQPDLVLNVDGLTELVEGAANQDAGAHPFQPAASIFGPMDLSTGSDRETMDLLIEARKEHNDADELMARTRSLKLFRSAILGDRVLERLAGNVAHIDDAIARYKEQVATKARVGVTGPEYTAPMVRRLDFIAESWAHTSISLDAICRVRAIDYVHVLEPASESAGPEVRRGYPLLLEQAETMRERGIRFVDGSRLPVPRKLARAIAAALVEAN